MHARHSQRGTGGEPAAAALLVLDMVNLFDFDGGAALGRAAVGIVPTIAALRERFDAVGAPTIYVNDNFARWQGGFDDLVVACRETGGPSAALVKRLAPRPHDYHVLKPKHSGFLATPLPILLAKLGVRKLVLTGVSADSCVLATAQDANMREFSVWVPGNAVAAISETRRQTALALLSRTLRADIRTTRAVTGVFPAPA